MKDSMNFQTMYPRPQFKKDFYQILNDGWMLNGEKINLPYPPEAKLSGYKGYIGEELHYTKQCRLSQQLAQKLFSDTDVTRKRGHILLHFGAVDQIADVYVNDTMVCHHEGGYIPFTVDITDVIETETFTLRVEAVDRLDLLYPYGKQRKKRGGMWYTQISGIWQSIWCEWVPDLYMDSVKIQTSGTKVTFTVCMSGKTTEEATIEIKTEQGNVFVETVHQEITIDMSLQKTVDGQLVTPLYWTCENPYLYEIAIRCGEDKAESYFGLRDVAIRKVGRYGRICINEKPVFLHGVLDQGYFEDGIFLPKSPSEYENDINRMKELGFNMLRKHIKIEPEWFYYACDRLGIYVMQDMVNNGPYHFLRDTVFPTFGIQKSHDRGRYRNAKQKENFIKTAEQTMRLLQNHPCIIGYTVFNEGWGQTDSDAIGDYLRAKDMSRFYDYTSGWFAQKHSDVDSVHVYFHTKKLQAKEKPLLLSEFGGFARTIKGHMYNEEKTYGYGTCKDEAELTQRIIATYEKMVLPAIEKGLCGAVYTQLSDIEDEINGFYTYDRKICKVQKEQIRKMSDRIRRLLS